MKKENLEECFQMALKWRKENGCNDDTDKNAEMCVTMNALRLFEELDLKGGILRIDGKIRSIYPSENQSARIHLLFT